LAKHSKDYYRKTSPPCSGNTANVCRTGIRHREVAIHTAVRKSYEEKNECLLLVDAENAFNKLNRKVSPENIKRLCVSSHAHIPTQQLQRFYHAISGK